MQNASEKPIALSTMARPNVLIKAEDAKGNWLGIPREAVGVSPWEGRKDALAPDAILRWEIPLASLRFIRQIAPGTNVKLRVEGPVQHVIPGKLHRAREQLYGHDVQGRVSRGLEGSRSTREVVEVNDLCLSAHSRTERS